MAAAAMQMTVPWHHWQSFVCLRNNGSGSGADDGALAFLLVCRLLA
jgi:hypothetical protein